MNRTTLIYEKKHLIADLPEGRFLLDTGSQISIGGTVQVVVLDGKACALPAVHPLAPWLTPEKLTEFVGVRIDGLIGNDILSDFGVVFDVPEASLWLSQHDGIDLEGEQIPMAFSQGLPVLPVKVGEKAERLIFDTGAPYYYYQGSFAPFAQVEPIRDFHPSCGWFTSQAAATTLKLGSQDFSVVCARLPASVAVSFDVTGTAGILGNEFMDQQPVGYFPRRGHLILGRN